MRNNDGGDDDPDPCDGDSALTTHKCVAVWNPSGSAFPNTNCPATGRQKTRRGSERLHERYCQIAGRSGASTGSGRSGRRSLRARASSKTSRLQRRMDAVPSVLRMVGNSDPLCPPYGAWRANAGNVLWASCVKFSGGRHDWIAQGPVGRLGSGMPDPGKRSIRGG